MRVVLIWLLAIFLPAAVRAQTVPHAELPSAEQPVRRVPTTGYTLALSWAPEYCHAHRGADDAECGSRAAAGFTLHGLWPDGDGPNRWPQYCHPVAILSHAQMADALAATPSPQLLQHEWAKHGSCTGDDPVRYFAEEGRLYRGVAMPDMAALARRRDVTAGDVQAAFARANPNLRPGMVRVNANRRGWLEEVWLCLGLDKRPRPCAASQGGAAPGAPLRVQAAGGNYNGYGGAPYRRSYQDRGYRQREYNGDYRGRSDVDRP